MKPFRFVHAADLHVDSPFKGLVGLPEAVRERIRESTYVALTRMVNVAIKEQVDFVLIAGDVYDAADRSLRAELRVQQAVRKLADHHIPVYVVHGNHDPLDGSRAKLEWPDSVHFFPTGTVETMIVRNRSGEEIAAISGISYGKSAVTDNLAAKFPNPLTGMYHIGLLHANVDGDARFDNYAPCSKDELVRSGYHYWALGHIHIRQTLHELPFIVYPGNIQGRNVKETGTKGCYVVDVDSHGETTLTFHETAAVLWEQRELSIGKLQDEQQLKDALEQLTEQLQEESGRLPVIVRVTLSGRGPLHTFLQNDNHLQELLAELRDTQAIAAEAGSQEGSFVWIESCRIATGADIPYEQLMEQENFIGDLLRMSENLIEDEQALALFYEESLDSLMGNARAAKLLREMSSEEIGALLRSARELAADELLGGA